MAAAAASTPTETCVTLPSDVDFEPAAPADEGFGAPLETALLGVAPDDDPELLPSAPPAFGAVSDFPMTIGKPGWPVHWPLKKSAKTFWSAGAEQAFGRPDFAALRMAWFLHIQAASVKAQPEEETA